MKRKIFCLLMSALLVFAAVGCNSQTTDVSAGSETSQGGSLQSDGETSEEISSPAGGETSQGESSLAGEESSYTPGTYTAAAQGNNGEVKVEVTFSETAIELVTILEHSESEGISDAAIERLPKEIVEYQSLGVDVVSGATMSSKAILAAVEDCVTQAGGDIEALKSVEVKKTGVDQSRTVDVLVIGAGTSGTTAALAAAEAGSKVLVIESNTTPGGAGAMTGGSTYSPGSSLDEATPEQVQQQIEEDLEYLMDYTHYMADRMLLRNYMEKSGSTVDWLMEHGMGFTSAQGNQTARYENRGTQQFLDLYDHMTSEYDVEILYETKGESLIPNEAGQIVGALATLPDGGTLTVECKSVVLATGGFGGNEEMLAQYVPGYVSDATNEGMYVDGSGHRMAWEVGASRGLVGLQVHNNSLPQIALGAGVNTRSGNEVDNIYSIANTPMLWVNNAGERFVNEDIMYSATLSGNVVYKEAKVYVVFDQATVDLAASEGLKLRAWRGDATVPLENLQKEIEEGIDIGYVFKGDTVEELAQNTGIDADTLAATIVRYNEHITAGVDEDYNKDSQYLLYSIEEGPYYIVQLAPRYLGTLGGLTINKDYQVLDDNGVAIPGLYTCGFNAASWMGSTYVDFTGITMSWALTSGRLAGEQAAAYQIP